MLGLRAEGDTSKISHEFHINNDLESSLKCMYYGKAYICKPILGGSEAGTI